MGKEPTKYCSIASGPTECISVFAVAKMWANSFAFYITHNNSIVAKNSFFVDITSSHYSLTISIISFFHCVQRNMSYKCIGKRMRLGIIRTGTQSIHSLPSYRLSSNRSQGHYAIDFWVFLLNMCKTLYPFSNHYKQNTTASCLHLSSVSIY